MRAPESDQNISHSVSLSPLKAGTNYYFRIKVGDQEYDNDGIPYSFKTKEIVMTPTAVPTIALVPTAVTGGNSGTTGCDHVTDYNKDKTINSLDYIYCLKNKPTRGAVTPTTGTTKCVSGVDYNKDGVINSLDRIKCLQDNK